MSRSRHLAQRRRALVALSDVHRAALTGTLDDLEHRTALLDVAVTAVRRVRRHRLLVGVAAMGLLIASLAARTWIRRAMWAAPLILEGYRLSRALAGARRREQEQFSLSDF